MITSMPILKNDSEHSPAVGDEVLRHRHDVGQALELVLGAMGQLSAEMDAEAKELVSHELRLQQALALPQRAAALRDLSVALRELITLERRLLGLGEDSRLLKAFTAMAACVGPLPAIKEAQADGQ